MNTIFRNWWYMGAVTGIFIPTQTPALRALLSKLVPADEVGRCTCSPQLFEQDRLADIALELNNTEDKQRCKRQTDICPEGAPV